MSHLTLLYRTGSSSLSSNTLISGQQTRYDRPFVLSKADFSYHLKDVLERSTSLK